MNEQSEVEKLRRKVEILQRKLSSAEESVRTQQLSMKNMMKTIEKTQKELAKYDHTRKEMEIIHRLSDIHKLVRSVRVLFENPRGGPIVSDRIEDLVHEIIKDLDKLSIANRTINIVEVV